MRVMTRAKNERSWSNTLGRRCTCLHFPSCPPHPHVQV
jgi:hypothetical protein